MNQPNENRPTPRPSASKNTPLFIVMALAGASLLAFYLGRQSAPPNNAQAPNVVESSERVPKEDSGGEGSANAGAGGGNEIKFEGDAAQMAGIQVAPASLRQLTSGIAFSGQIAANPNGVVRVASLVPGRVTQLYVSVGDRVRRGQTLAIVESRAIGEAQSAYQQAVSRLETAQSNLNVVMRQAQAGVFSRGPVEIARKAQVEAQADVRAGETAVRGAQVVLDNGVRLAKAGSFANPALEAALGQSDAVEEASKTAEAALDNARSAVESAQSELERRKQQAAAGAYQSRPVEEAKRAVVAARSARGAAQSEVATTRANLTRAKALVGEGLVSQRDLESAQNAFDTATANLESTQSEETTAQSELERQQKLASTNVAGVAEVQDAQAKLSSGQADVRTRQAELNRAEQGKKLAALALAREQTVFNQNIANRREVSTARGALETARNALEKARQTFALTDSVLKREVHIFQQNLNNIAQVQTARSSYAQAQSDVRAARTALALFKSAPGRSAQVPIVAPIGGIVQERKVARGEVLDADAQVLTLVNTDTVAIEAAIYERDMARLRVGSLVKISVDGLPGRTFSGHINFISNQLDPETRTLTARALLPNAGELRSGMFARGQVVTMTSAPVVSVPCDAVQKLEDKTVVFVPSDEPNTFKPRTVRTGATEGGQTAIQSGLKPGEKVVVKGAFVVKSQAMKAELGDED